MRQIVRLALPMLLTACSAVLGIDGDYDDAPRSDAGSGASGGAAGAGAGGAGNSGGTSGTGGTSAAGGTGAAGGASGAGGTVATGGTSASGGSGGATSGEICGNGIDDDGDLLIDCKDPECAPAKCAPPVPSGWTGPAVLWTGDPSATPPACPGGATPVVTLELYAPGADCSTVTCSCEVTGTCTASSTVTHYGAPDCSTGPVVSTMTLNNTSCMPYSMTAAASGGVKATFTTSNGQTCTPKTTGSGSVPAAEFPKRLALCPTPASGGGCTSGTCVTPAPSHPTVCIHRTGNLGCPSTYPNRTEAGLSVSSDSRGCSPCKCTAPFCYPTVKDHPNSTCGAGSSVYTSCNSAYNATALPRSLKLSIDPGTCGVTGGSATGSLSLVGARTICCL